MGARLSATVQSDPGAHPNFYATGTASYPAVKRPGRGVDHPPRLAPRLKNEYSYTSTPPPGPSWSVLWWALCLITVISNMNGQAKSICLIHTRVGTLIVATIYLQLIQNRYMFRSFTVLQCSH